MNAAMIYDVKNTNSQSAVTVAICTFRRPHLLKNLLEDISNLEFRKCKDVQIEVVIVDNDKALSAENVFYDFKSNFQFPLKYVAEEEKGLVNARNKALELGSNADFIAFLDDDELVDKFWLDELVWHGISTDAAFVIGPVQPVFPPGTSIRLIESGLYHRPEFLDGTVIYNGNTGNSLIRCSFIKSNSIIFNPIFQETGGEDTNFFHEIVKNGGHGVYALHAKAWEPVNSDRLSILWLLRRRCRYGATTVAQEFLDNRSIILSRFKWLFLGIARLSVAVIASPILFIINDSRAIRIACGGARGFGFILGALGLSVNEYGEDGTKKNA